MKATASCPSPGVYQYSYTTFTDVPKHLCIHFLTPDRQQAFVSYPHRPYKTARLIPVNWFNSVETVQLKGKPRLLAFIAFLVADLLGDSGLSGSLTKASAGELEAYLVSELLDV